MAEGTKEHKALFHWTFPKKSLVPHTGGRQGVTAADFSSPGACKSCTFASGSFQRAAPCPASNDGTPSEHSSDAQVKYCSLPKPTSQFRRGLILCVKSNMISCPSAPEKAHSDTRLPLIRCQEGRQKKIQEDKGRKVTLESL